MPTFNSTTYYTFIGSGQKACSLVAEACVRLSFECIVEVWELGRRGQVMTLREQWWR